MLNIIYLSRHVHLKMMWFWDGFCPKIIRIFFEDEGEYHWFNDSFLLIHSLSWWSFPCLLPQLILVHLFLCFLNYFSCRVSFFNLLFLAVYSCSCHSSGRWKYMQRLHSFAFLLLVIPFTCTCMLQDWLVFFFLISLLCNSWWTRFKRKRDAL